MTFEPKPGGKVLAAIAHDALESQDAVDHWKAFWKARLAGL